MGYKLLESMATYQIRYMKLHLKDTPCIRTERKSRGEMINWRKKIVSRFNCIFIQCNPKQNHERIRILLHSDCFWRYFAWAGVGRKHWASVSYFKTFFGGYDLVDYIFRSVRPLFYFFCSSWNFLRGAIFSFPLRLIESLERGWVDLLYFPNSPS